MSEVLDGPDGLPLTVVPQTAQMVCSESLELNVSGGFPPYSYLIKESSGGEGESLIDGVYKAPAAGCWSVVIEVEDSSGNIQESSIDVIESSSSETGPLVLSPSEITIFGGNKVSLTPGGGTGEYTLVLQNPLGGTGELLSGREYTAPSDLEGQAVIRLSDGVSTPQDSIITVSQLTAAGLIIMPSSASLTTGSHYTFSAYGGLSPYTFSIYDSESGSPDIDPASGMYSAGANTGTDTVRVTDSNGTTSDTVVTVTAITSDVNYNSVSVNNTGSTDSGSSLSGTFAFSNSGAGNGSQDIIWEVYISSDDTIGAGDSLIDNGVLSPLAGGASVLSTGFSGNWPLSSSDTGYYIIVKLQASDDLITTDNRGSTFVNVSAAADSAVDYEITEVNSPSSSVESGGTATGTFRILNTSTTAGAYNIFWTAYLSENTSLDVSDSELDSGVLSALTGSGSSTDITFSGSCTSSGVYYVLIKILAGDDVSLSNNILAGTSFSVNSAPGSVDYRVSDLSKNYPVVSGGSYCSETFTLTNTGGTGGGSTVYWSAYASEDNILETGSDFQITDNAELSPLAAGNSQTGIALTGTWPESSGDYFLFITVSSSDETVTDNNTAVNGTYSLISPPDYIISTPVAVTNDGTPSMGLGSSGDFSFNISESGGNDGHQQIGWEVFASTDSVLDSGDSSLKTGFISALSSGATSSDIEFHTASWPTLGSYYFLIIQITSGDDSDTSNNTWVSDRIAVPLVHTDLAVSNSDDGVNIADGANYSLIPDAGLDFCELYHIKGVTKNKNTFNTFRFTLGSGFSSITVSADWDSGYNEIDLYLWEKSGPVWSSGTPAINSEPGTGAARFNGLTAGKVYYLGVEFTPSSDNGSYPYNIYVYGDSQRPSF